MTVYKKIGLSLAVIIAGTPLLTFIVKKELTLTQVSDNFFMVSLLFLIIGVFILVLSSGFFDFFQKNMKHLIQLRRSNEPKEYIPLSEIFKKKPVYWLATGGILLIISIILTIIA